MRKYYDTDIIEINSKGILFSDNYFLLFDDSRNEWLKEHKIKETTCVAERYGENGKYFFVFRGKEDIKVEFEAKGIYANRKKQKKFHLFRIELEKKGYTTYDMT